MGKQESTEVRVSDTPETDAALFRSEQGKTICDETVSLCRRLERERNLALAIARKYCVCPELKNFPNEKP